jgi:hypothetical protein
MYLEFQKRRDGRVLLTVVEEDGVRRSAIVSAASEEALRLPAPVLEAAESLRGIWRDLPHGDMLTFTI